MKSHAQVVVIGGGVVGASVLYHLTKAGWKDVLLIERAELTSGSTWHAAGGMHTVNGDPNVAKLQQYTIDLYKEIEQISGQSCGVHITGGVMLGGHARAARLAQDGQGARPLSRHGSRDHFGATKPRGFSRCMDKKHFAGAHVRSDRGPRRPLRRHPRLCQVGADRRRRDRAPHARHGSQGARRRHLGRDHGPGQRARRARGQCGAACGRARSGAWSASSCRCSPWSTST